jgi:hypothetical protein
MRVISTFLDMVFSLFDDWFQAGIETPRVNGPAKGNEMAKFSLTREVAVTPKAIQITRGVAFLWTDPAKAIS